MHPTHKIPHTTILRSRTLGATHPTRALAHHWHYSQLTLLAPSRLYPLRQWHKAACRCLALERVDDRYLLTSGVDAAIALWDTKPEIDDVSVRGAGGRIRPVASIAPHASHASCVTSLAWYPNDTGIFVTGSLDHSIRVWDTNHLEEAASFDLGSEIHALSMSTSALIASAAQEPNVRLCDLRSGANVQALRGHAGEVRSVTWFPEHEYLLASGSTDGTLRIWDTRQSRSQLALMQAGESHRMGTSQAMLAAVTGISVAPDGSYAVVMLGTSGYTQVWDLHAHVLMAGTRTQHTSPHTSPPALLHTSTQHTSPPGYFVPSNQDVLFVDLYESSTPRLPLAFAQRASDPRLSRGHLVGASHARTRRVGTLLSSVSAVVYSAKRMSLMSADEGGGVVVWDTSAAGVAVAGPGKRTKSDGQNEEDVVVRYAWEQDNQGEGQAVKRARMDEWSDDED